MCRQSDEFKMGFFDSMIQAAVIDDRIFDTMGIERLSVAAGGRWFIRRTTA
jgi:hypothetical protein